MRERRPAVGGRAIHFRTFQTNVSHGNGITFGAVAAEIIRDQLLQRPNAAARLFRFGR